MNNRDNNERRRRKWNPIEKHQKEPFTRRSNNDWATDAWTFHSFANWFPLVRSKLAFLASGMTFVQRRWKKGLGFFRLSSFLIFVRVFSICYFSSFLYLNHNSSLSSVVSSFWVVERVRTEDIWKFCPHPSLWSPSILLNLLPLVTSKLTVVNYLMNLDDIEYALFFFGISDLWCVIDLS